MAGLERCLAQIDAIRSVASGDQPPYVARSRIGRLTSSVANLVARHVGGPPPIWDPGAIELPTTETASIRAVAVRCNHVVAIGSHLSQPSEPLDDRWKRGWSGLLAELQELEAALCALERDASV